MGVHPNVGINKFPKQGDWLNKEAKVMFNFDSSTMIKGVIVRDDMEEPFLTLIKLEDGRVIRSTECQYSLI
ncbi:hypothetical protein CN680_26045 [Bacillus pseudomycoides]|uniref:hypothetical protein n=1 Tax=Bacillus pseudomycoides TaxID=64104 RepID=UPI000BF1E372|nr:hypothetical protein [Bacillus pseudomycoides]PEJ68687.1 hypothetical protein CN680_26045 [Bacillus pseudomycoides]PEO77520.1 hypothetical protein CN571_30030 [Bacillus pseudomycoides]